MKNIIDISYAQGKISDAQWKYFKENLTGIIIRFGYRGYSNGNVKLDKYLDYNVFKCQEYNIPYGLYIFSQAMDKQEGIEEANAIISSEYFNNATLGIWFDSELANDGNGRADNISVESRTEAAKGFCDTIILANKKTGIYASSNWFISRLDMSKLQYPIWVAHYGNDYSYKKNVVLWQYSSSNPMLIPGFAELDCNKIVDESFFNNSSPVLAKSKKYFIQQIQKALGVKADGIFGPKTLAATITVSKTKNRKHPVVKTLQEYLNYLGYNCGVVDGIAGVKFDSAIKRFQKDHDCIVDGELTAQRTTWKRILTI